MLDLHGWDIRSLLPSRALADSGARVIEIEASDTCCLLYDFFEVHYLAYVGELSIFRHMQSPVPILNPVGFPCFWTNNTMQWDQSGTILFVTAYVEWQDRHTANVPMVIIDLTQERFSFVSANSLSRHTVIQLDDRAFRIELPAQYGVYKIEPAMIDVNLEQMPWFGFGQIGDFEAIYRSAQPA